MMTKRILQIAAGLMVGAIIIGCSTEKPWEPTPPRPLQVIIVSGPDTSTAVPHGSYVNFSWIARGGSEKFAGYQWYLEPIETGYGAASMATSAYYSGLAGADGGLTYTFHVRVTDDAGATATATRSFVVADTAVIPDTIAPTVLITQSPTAGSFVATGTNVKFAWEGDDGQGIRNSLEYQYVFDPTNDTSDWTPATTAVIADVPTANPAVFKVRARDASGNVSEWDSVSFIIKPASILYVDDYLFVDAYGDPDMPKERDQKQFYRDVLAGYAFAEWDIARQGMPDSSDLVDNGTPVYSTIVFCSDSHLGSTDGTWWYEVGAVGGGVIRYYLENGGKILITGALTLLDMGDYDPNNGPTPRPGDFEYDWLGIDSTEWCYDYWMEFTWAVKNPAATYDLPDSMKIDVAKNGNQLDYATETPGLQSNAEVLFTWGLDVNGEEPHAYGHPVGHIVSFSGVPRTAMLNFDTYSMPKPEITRTFRAILAAFGE